MAEIEKNKKRKIEDKEVKKSNNKSGKESKNISSKFKLIISISVFVIIVAGAFSLTKYVFLPLSRKYQVNRQIKEVAQAQAESDKIPEMGLVYVIDNLTVNTLGSNGYRIVVAELTLESKEQAVIDEIEAREPQLRDVFIKYLRSHSANEISSLSFQEDSRSELIKIVNEHLNSGVIDSLYYVKLILQ